jgi:transglutaminase-like putative cysteine protease
MTANLRARLGPAPDWTSLALVATMAVTVGWSLDGAALVLGRQDWTDFLPWAALGGVIAGFIGARVGWNRPLAHFIGAIFAVLIVGILVGAVLDVAGNLGQKFAATSNATVDAVLDFAVYEAVLTRQTGHYLLVLGLLCWANGQFAASAVFRQGRPIGPIIVLGAVLVANMSATTEKQIWLMVLFSLASLLLLIRLHALDERATWIRRRIGDPATVTSLYIRGGSAFIAIAVFLAVTLTASATSAPLAGFWDDARPTLVEISQFLQRIIPPAPGSRPIGFPSFGPQVAVGGLWATASEPALEIDGVLKEDSQLYWRATTYDTFTLQGWTTTAPATTDRKADSPLLANTLDAIPSTSLRESSTFTVKPVSDVWHVAFSPNDPLSINRDVTLNLSGQDGFLQSISASGHEPYEITASIPSTQDVKGGFTQNRLRAAGTDYPPAVTARYLAVPPDSMGPAAKGLLKHVLDVVKQRTKNQVTPYDVATEIVDELQNKNVFTYQTNVLGVCDNSPSIVECFAQFKQGYCEHYASTMAILLRAANIPSRLVEGFLPGTLNTSTGVESIRTDGAHAWVEVYFPGYGWQMFDPTGGGRANAPELPAGAVQPLPSVAPRPSAVLPSLPPRDQPNRPVQPGEFSDPSRAVASNPGLFVAIAIGLLAAVLLVAFLAWRRGPGGATSTPDGVYASIADLARRFGFGPRPTQTAYEYATALGDILPSVKPELQTVATAKVEVAYGQRQLGEDRMRALRDAYQKLRVGLLRLAFRRGDRRRMRHGSGRPPGR